MRLLISGSHTAPLVFFDLQASFLRIAGTSTMSDAALFYSNLARWIEDNAIHIKPHTDLVFSLQFLNSASIRALHKFLRVIKDAQIPLRIVIIRLEPSDNSDVVEFLEEACRLLELPYEVRQESFGTGKLYPSE